jgi:hypothetical protein
MGPMERATTTTLPSAYRARLRGGPDDGAVVHVSALPGGGPPDFFHAGPDDPGMYVLAGAPRDDGSLPYWFVSSLPADDALGEPRCSTWTLVSVSGDGGHPKVWHQHGAGASPVRLQARRIGSARTPSCTDRAYYCPECGDTTVISLPEG